MTFRARIRRNSTIWRLWRSQGRVSGVLVSAAFRWDGTDYHAGVLTVDQVTALANHRDVEIEATAAPPLSVEVKPEVEPEILTHAHQQIMDRALRQSVRIIAEPEPEVEMESKTYPEDHMHHSTRQVRTGGRFARRDR